MAIRSRSLPKHSRLGLEKLESRLVPASFFVNNGDVAGLIAAINTANTDGQSDVIHLAKNGSYTLSAVADTSLGATGLPAILADGNLTIQGNGATITRGQSAPLFRLIAVNGGDLTLNRVTLTNGNSDGALPLADGGGIRVEAGSLTVNQCLFENNQTPRLAFPNFGNGGAIGLRPNTVATITDSVFTGNSAFDGGAINSVGATALDLHNCSFINNGALGAEDGLLASDGGAVNISAFTVPTVTSITNSRFGTASSRATLRPYPGFSRSTSLAAAPSVRLMSNLRFRTAG
jgi:predicted outer membrane repeat protein